MQTIRAAQRDRWNGMLAHAWPGRAAAAVIDSRITSDDMFLFLVWQSGPLIIGHASSRRARHAPGH
jgi:hypothetical protein